MGLRGVGHDWVTVYIYIYTLRVSISSRGNVTNVDLPVISLSSKSSNLLAGNAGILFVKVGAKVPFSIEFSASPSDSVCLYFWHSGALFWAACSFMLVMSSLQVTCLIPMMCSRASGPATQAPVQLLFGGHLVHLFTSIHLSLLI